MSTLPICFVHPGANPMSIEFNCRYCSKTLRVADESAGKKCKCPSCSATLEIPQSDSPPREGRAGAEQRDTPADVLQIGCPRCRVVLHYVSALEGTRGMCKGCGHIFTLSQKAIDAPVTDSFPFECPACHFIFEGKPGMEGKKGKCTECNEVFFITPLKLESPKPTVAPVQVSKPEPKHSFTPPTPKAKPTSPSKSVSNRNPPQTPTSPAKSVWDDLSLPAANWDAPSQAPLTNPYSVSYPSSGSYSSSAKRNPSYDRETLRSIAYWYRALVTSFLWSLLIGFLNGIMMVLLQIVLDPQNPNLLVLLAVGIPLAFLLLIAIFLSIRFLVSYIFLCIRLYPGLVAALFIVGSFLGCVPFLPLILLIVVLVKAHSVLQGAGYRVGLTGVDPNQL